MSLANHERDHADEINWSKECGDGREDDDGEDEISGAGHAQKGDQHDWPASRHQSRRPIVAPHAPHADSQMSQTGQTKRRKQRSAATPGMADLTIDLTDESSDVEVCNVDDDVVVVKQTVRGNSVTVLVHEKGRGAPVSVSRRCSPHKRRAAGPAPAPLPPPSPKKTLKCPVCLDSMMEKDKRLVSTKCGHIFCEVCIRDSLRVTKQCPACRMKLTGKTAFHPIFL